MNEEFHEFSPRKFEYFYRVEEFLTTFGKDKEQNEPITHTQEFRENGILARREDAYKYYEGRLQGIEEKGRYFLPFASPEDFKAGENSAFSIWLSFVEVIDGNEYEHILEGEDEEECNESLEYEQNVISNLLQSENET